VLATSPIALAGPAFTNPANGHAYLLTPSVMSWQDARTFATNAGGYLTSIGDAAENDWIVSTFAPLLPQDEFGLWIGLSDELTEGVFLWESGEPLAYTNWHPSEPNDFPSSPAGEDYAFMLTRDAPGEWIDGPSPFYNSQPYSYFGVVEIVPTAPTSSVLACLGMLALRRRRR